MQLTWICFIFCSMLPRRGERRFDRTHPGRSTNVRMIYGPHLCSKHTECSIGIRGLGNEDFGVWSCLTSDHDLDKEKFRGERWIRRPRTVLSKVHKRQLRKPEMLEDIYRCDLPQWYQGKMHPMQETLPCNLYSSFSASFVSKIQSR